MSWFGAKRAESIALLDVAADSVGGAAIVAREGGLAEIVYAERVPLEPHDGEAESAALARSLASTTSSLARVGGPALVRAGASAAPHKVIAVLGAPYEEPRVRTEQIVGERAPFVFTRAAVKDALKKNAQEPQGEFLTDEAVLATFLDGYETKAPWGRKASRASIVLLSSLAKEGVLAPVADALRKAYHTRTLEGASAALAFARAFLTLFPHEEECLVIVARGAHVTLLLIKGDMLAGLTLGVLTPDSASGLAAAMTELATEHPLPHSVFLIAEEARREELKQALGGERFAQLWLSDIPPRVRPVLPEHLQLSGKVKLVGDARPDLFLGLLALFCTQPEAGVP